jgi:hypothetical protein
MTFWFCENVFVREIGRVSDVQYCFCEGDWIIWGWSTGRCFDLAIRLCRGMEKLLMGRDYLVETTIW